MSIEKYFKSQKAFKEFVKLQQYSNKCILSPEYLNQTTILQKQFNQYSPSPEYLNQTTILQKQFNQYSPSPEYLNQTAILQKQFNQYFLSSEYLNQTTILQKQFKQYFESTEWLNQIAKLQKRFSKIADSAFPIQIQNQIDFKFNLTDNISTVFSNLDTKISPLSSSFLSKLCSTINTISLKNNTVTMPKIFIQNNSDIPLETSRKIEIKHISISDAISIICNLIMLLFATFTFLQDFHTVKSSELPQQTIVNELPAKNTVDSNKNDLLQQILDAINEKDKLSQQNTDVTNELLQKILDAINNKNELSQQNTDTTNKLLQKILDAINNKNELSQQNTDAINELLQKILDAINDKNELSQQNTDTINNSELSQKKNELLQEILDNTEYLIAIFNSLEELERSPDGD